MSIAVQSPTTLPLMHRSSPEVEVPARGTLPQGKTLEKVIAVLGAINITLTTAASAFLSRQLGSVSRMEQLSSERKNEMFAKAFVMTFLGSAAAVATGASGFAPFIAPALQGFNANITEAMVESTSKAAGVGLNCFTQASQAYYDGVTGEISDRYNIEQSVVMQAALQANTDAERQRDTLNQHCSQIIQSQNRANG